MPSRVLKSEKWEKDEGAGVIPFAILRANCHLLLRLYIIRLSLYTFGLFVC